jgi:hypothetical protein
LQNAREWKRKRKMKRKRKGKGTERDKRERESGHDVLPPSHYSWCYWAGWMVVARRDGS